MAFSFFWGARNPFHLTGAWEGRNKICLFPVSAWAHKMPANLLMAFLRPANGFNNSKLPCECLGAGNANQFVDGLFCVRQTGLGAKKLPAIAARVPPGIVLGQVVFLFVN